jgi:phosphate-selective porin OprO/OprP
MDRISGLSISAGGLARRERNDFWDRDSAIVGPTGVSLRWGRHLASLYLFGYNAFAGSRGGAMRVIAGRAGFVPKALLLSGVAMLALGATPALAASKKAPDKLELLEQQIKVLQEQVQDLKATQASKYADVKKSVDDLPKVTLDAGRPTFKTADGNFSASLRGLIQFDTAYYSQRGIRTQAGNGTDLNSGSNFRRVRFGLEGTLYKNWAYNFIAEYGGSGSEGPVQINQAYLQYTGLKPVFLRIGAFTPYASLEDSTSASDTLFLERATATEITRNIAGGDGREGISLVAQGDRYLASVAYTGNKVTVGSAGGTQTFDEQQGVVGRLAGLVYTTPKANVVLGANGSYVFDTASLTANSSTSGTVVFQNSPELRVDDSSSSTSLTPANLISTTPTGGTAFSARQAWHFGVDAAAQVYGAYLEGGYFKFGADRRGGGAAASNPEFDAWYAQASYILTGESRRYNATQASFRSPKVAHPFNFGKDAGWGAWEVAGRYSFTDLNFNPGKLGSALPAGGIRGGEQTIWTLGLNWYPNDALRFSLNYLIADIDRLNGGTAVGQVPANGQLGPSFHAIALRSQVNF